MLESQFTLTLLLQIVKPCSFTIDAFSFFPVNMMINSIFGDKLGNDLIGFLSSVVPIQSLFTVLICPIGSKRYADRLFNEPLYDSPTYSVFYKKVFSIHLIHFH